MSLKTLCHVLLRALAPSKDQPSTRASFVSAGQEHIGITVGLSFPIATGLVILEAAIVAAFFLMLWLSRSSTNAWLRRHWRPYFILTVLAGVLPALLSIVEVSGDLLSGVTSSVTVKPLMFLIGAIVLPALVWHRAATLKENDR